MYRHYAMPGLMARWKLDRAEMAGKVYRVG